MIDGTFTQQRFLAETATSSSGHVLSSPDWLNTHFNACQAEYEALLRFAEFKVGSKILDAGCGSGSFLPLLREVVGDLGNVSALDAAEENVEHVSKRLGDVVDMVVVGTVAQLPFADDSFDGLWCANTVQFLDDDELVEVIGEFARVVRPGGRIAVKDVDMTGLRLAPAPPFLGVHLAEACTRKETVAKESHGSLRGRELRYWLQKGGLEGVQQSSRVIERWSPLDEAGSRLWSHWLPYLAALASDAPVPAEDLAFWAEVATAEGALRFTLRPDFYACELQSVAVGQVPGRDAGVNG